MTVEEMIGALDVLLDKQDYAGARALLYESLRSFQTAGDVPAAISTCNELMGFERQYGEDGAAITAAEEALRLLEERDMAVSRPAAMVTLNAATVYAKAGRPAEARALYDRAETLFYKYYPAGAAEFAGLYNNRASVYLTPAEFPKAEYYYTRALQLLERRGEVCDAAVTHLNLAGLYARWPERAAEAPLHTAQAVRLMDLPADRRNAYYYYTCRKCAAACRELGEDAAAAFFTGRANEHEAGD